MLSIGLMKPTSFILACKPHWIWDKRMLGPKIRGWTVCRRRMLQGKILPSWTLLWGCHCLHLRLTRVQWLVKKCKFILRNKLKFVLNVLSMKFMNILGKFDNSSSSYSWKWNTLLWGYEWYFKKTFSNWAYKALSFPLILMTDNIKTCLFSKTAISVVSSLLWLKGKGWQHKGNETLAPLKKLLLILICTFSIHYKKSFWRRVAQHRIYRVLPSSIHVWLSDYRWWKRDWNLLWSPIQ